MDETLSPYCPLNSFTYAPAGSLAMIWTGLTSRCIPVGPWPSGHWNSFAGAVGKDDAGTKKSSKWQNRHTINELLCYLVKPYLDFLRSDPTFLEECANFNKGTTGLWISDNHWSHTAETTLDHLRALDLEAEFLPPRATDLFSVLDVSINRAYKTQLRNQFTEHVTAQLSEQLRAGTPAGCTKLDIRLATLKPLVCKWVSAAYGHMKENERELVGKGWAKVHSNVEKLIGPYPRSYCPFSAINTRSYATECFGSNYDKPTVFYQQIRRPRGRSAYADLGMLVHFPFLFFILFLTVT